MRMMPDNTVSLRITVLEKAVADLKIQLSLYVPVRENELQLKSIRDTVERIEDELQDVKRQLTENNEQAVRRDAKQKDSQAALQIKILWSMISFVIVVLSGFLIGYFTHLLH